MTSGAIVGDWTHRRRDPGGTRSLSADVSRARPEIAWSWRPSHAGSVDQVRIAGDHVHVATMAPGDPDAPGWEHATIFSLDAATGLVVAQRTLADPAPVAAMAIEQGVVHVVATRKDEPIFLYGLGTGDLRPCQRRRITLDRDERREDVLDAWVMPGGDVWLEIESAFGGARAYASVSEGSNVAAAQTHADDVAGGGWGSPARDACTDGHALFAPLAGHDDGAMTPALWQVSPTAPFPHEVDSGQILVPPATAAWASFDVRGPKSQAHTLAAEGLVAAVAIALDVEKEDRASLQAIAVDRASGVVRWATPVGKIPLRGALGDSARLARRVNGELLFQRLLSDGTPCTDLARIRADGTIDVVALGNNGKRFVLDAAIGNLVLAHHEADNGRVTVAALDIDRESRILGRRTTTTWSIETPDLGGGVTVYAGAGHVFVRGSRALVAVRV